MKEERNMQKQTTNYPPPLTGAQKKEKLECEDRKKEEPWLEYRRHKEKDGTWTAGCVQIPEDRMDYMQSKAFREAKERKESEERKRARDKGSEKVMSKADELLEWCRQGETSIENLGNPMSRKEKVELGTLFTDNVEMMLIYINKPAIADEKLKALKCLAGLMKKSVDAFVNKTPDR